MKVLNYIFLIVLTISFASCKSSSGLTNEARSERAGEEKDKISITLLNRIRQLPGISLKNGVPVFSKGNNSLHSSGEPLYVLDDYAVGNSFNSVNGLVVSANVKKIEALSGSDASFYGSRAASGVIKITTYQ